MSLSRDLFAKNKELRESWGAVANSDWFQQVLVFARADFMEGDLKDGEMTGAKRFENILLDLAKQEPTSQPQPSSGIHHDLDVKPRSKQPEPKN